MLAFCPAATCKVSCTFASVLCPSAVGFGLYYVSSTVSRAWVLQHAGLQAACMAEHVMRAADTAHTALDIRAAHAWCCLLLGRQLAAGCMVRHHAVSKHLHSTDRGV